MNSDADCYELRHTAMRTALSEAPLEREAEEVFPELGESSIQRGADVETLLNAYFKRSLTGTLKEP